MTGELSFSSQFYLPRLHKLPTCLLAKHLVCETQAKSVKVSLAEIASVV